MEFPKRKHPSALRSNLNAGTQYISKICLIIWECVDFIMRILLCAQYAKFDEAKWMFPFLAFSNDEHSILKSGLIGLLVESER